MVESAALLDGDSHIATRSSMRAPNLPRSFYRDLSSCPPSHRINSMVLIELAATSSALTSPHCCATISPVG